MKRNINGELRDTVSTFRYGKEEVVMIDGGVVEVLNNNVVVLAESVIED